ncbi:MAG: type II toxin-antitoxin system HicA family toxin [Oscillospiraceae bacterium]|nr:type II toxin-antitoxin system HicA family toxin [Oscillospiraceae bacterium]
MSKKEKLIKRLLSRPKDFTFEELVTLLGLLGYEPDKGGKTGGSRVKFVNTRSDALWQHRPHPGNILKAYQVKDVIDNLTERGLL